LDFKDWISNIILALQQYLGGVGKDIALLIIGWAGHTVWENYKEKQMRHKESLKNHFNQIEENAIRPLIDILKRIYASDAGLFVAPPSQNYGGDKPVWPTKNFDEGDFLNFKLHFPNLAGPLEQFIKKVDEKNKKIDLLMQQLQSDIEQDIHVCFKYNVEAPCLDDAILHDIKETSLKIAKDKSNGKTSSGIAYSLEKSEVIHIVAGGTDFWWLRTERGTRFAFLDNETEANEVKAKLLKFINSAPIVDEITTLFQDTIKLEKEARTLSNHLEFTCQQYSIYGTFMKKKKLCPICQIIFGN